MQLPSPAVCESLLFRLSVLLELRLAGLLPRHVCDLNSGLPEVVMLQWDLWQGCL